VYEGTTLYFRGIRIVHAVLDDLTSKGLKNASDVIINGCSAGGLATSLHADYIKDFLPSSVNVKAMSDAAFFLDAKNCQGDHRFRSLIQYGMAPTLLFCTYIMPYMLFLLCKTH
jgi:hypothetical protein